MASEGPQGHGSKPGLFFPYFVMLNLLQHPLGWVNWTLRSARKQMVKVSPAKIGLAMKWTLKQVQDDTKKKRWSGLAAALYLICCPAKADTLIDNVQGITLNDQGKLEGFTAVLISTDGHISRVFKGAEKRPRSDFRFDGGGRVLMPGLIHAHIDLTGLGLKLLGPAGPGAKLRPEDRDQAFYKAQQWLIERGITAVTDMNCTIEAWQSYRRAGDSGRLNIRIMGYAPSIEGMVLIGGPGPSPWLYDDRLKFNGLHIEKAQPIQLKNMLSRAALDGFQGVIDASPDLSAILDAIAEQTTVYKGERRWRVDFAAAPDAATLAKLEQASVVAITVPDSENMVAAAFPNATMRAAWAAFAEGKIGRIEQGKRADFVLLDRAPIVAAPAPPSKAKVMQTWVGGRIVYQAKELSGN